VQEALVEDNKRYYEVLLLSSKQNQQPVSAVGEQIWQAENATQLDVAERYLKQTLSHYQRIAKGKNNDVAHIITAYEQVKPTLNT
jgi:tRNA (adenine22-N1)-methyltransferase